MKKFVIFMLMIVCLTLPVACGTTESPDPDQTTVETYTVTFENTSLAPVSLKKGDTLQRPNAPEKSACVFVGWYTDAAFTAEAAFPLTVNADTVLYAQFYSYEEAFAKARENTVGDDVPGFSYTYTLDMNVLYNAVELVGKTTGSAKYSSVGAVNFYDEGINTGVLFYDGSAYKIRRGSTLQSISLDENGKMRKFSVEQVGSDYKYDSSSLAKAVFSYSDEQLKSISATDKKNVYQLDTSASASSVIALIANYINHPIVDKLLCELPITSADTALYVTFENDKIESYTYTFDVNVSAFTLKLQYELVFTDSGKAQTITPKTFEGVALAPDEVKNVSDEVAAIVDAYKKQTSSGYAFVAKTGVDFGALSGEINSTFKGSAFRKNQNGSVFFHNDIEIDSDFKNADLYKNQGIADAHIKKTKLSNGEVYLIEKKLLLDSTKKIDGFEDSDNTSFYLFDLFTNSGVFSFVETETKDGKTVYTFGVTNEGAASLMAWLNACLDLDPLSKASVDAKVWGDFDASSVLVKSGSLTVTVENGKLVDMTAKIDADSMTAFVGSSEFSQKANAQMKLELTVTPDAKGDTFEPFETVKEAQ